MSSAGLTSSSGLLSSGSSQGLFLRASSTSPSSVSSKSKSLIVHLLFNHRAGANLSSSSGVVLLGELRELSDGAMFPSWCISAVTTCPICSALGEVCAPSLAPDAVTLSFWSVSAVTPHGVRSALISGAKPTHLVDDCCIQPVILTYCKPLT